MRQYVVLVLADKKEQGVLEQLIAQEYEVVVCSTFSEAQELVRWSRDMLVILTDGVGQQELDQEHSAFLELVRQSGRPLLMLIQKGIQAQKAFALGAAEVIGEDYVDAVLNRRIAQLMRQEELKWEREYDIVSGVYNKQAFYRHTEQLLYSQGQPYAMMCIDIERFKLVNDLYGTMEGDRLLRYLGRQLLQDLREDREIAGHIVSDVFAVCLPMDMVRISQLARSALEHIKKYPINMELTLAMGIYPIEDIAMGVSSMCDRAIMALKTIKGSYQVHLAFYDDEMRRTMLLEQQLIDTMEMALDNGEFQVYYQPKCDMRTGAVVGAEALVRWAHPQKGLINPTEFVSFFERNGFILELDMYVWEEVCKAINAWLDRGYQVVPVSVNVSQSHLYNAGFPAQLMSLLAKYQIPPTLFELEITESVCAQSLEQLQQIIELLHAQGLCILMDDFGSGYSSLNILQTIDVDVLKMDMQFLTRSHQVDRRSGNIMESVIRMARWLNLEIIAEGVQNQNQVDFLLSVGCRLAQGYYYYEPMNRLEFETLLLKETSESGELKSEETGEVVLIGDLFHIDAVSERILSNLLGAVVIYTYQDGEVMIQQATEAYYQLIGRKKLYDHQYIKNCVHVEDWPIIQAVLDKAAKRPEKGVQAIFRQRHSDGRMLRLYSRVSFWGMIGGRQVFCASLSKIDEEE